jgi:flagellar hook assembly protein FlgD
MRRTRSLRHLHHSRILLAATAVAAGLLVAVWIAPRASGAVATWIEAPPVRLHTLSLPGGERLGVARASARGDAVPVVLDAGESFTVAGVLCDAPAGAEVNVRLKASSDGTTWGPWLTVALEVAGEGTSRQAYADPVWTGDARYLQIEAAGAAGSPATLTGVRVVTIDPREATGAVARLTGAVRRVAAAVAGVSFDQPAVAASTAPAIVTRSQWGADERLRSGSPSYAPVKMAFVHHTAGSNTYTQADAPGLVRAIYAFHTNPKGLAWSDIGYNFLVDRFGTIYEGRYGGVSRGVVGAHVYGFNTGSTGVSVMGTYTDTGPPTAAVAALERVLAWKLGVAGLNATGTATLTCGATDKFKSGVAVKFPVIAGHKQANYTECPGDAFYKLLPAIRLNVAKRMGGGGGGDGGGTVTGSLSASSTLVSPNGDGSLDTVDFSVQLSAAAEWRVAITDSGGTTLGGWSGQSASASLTWDGQFGGSKVPDGAYTVELTATADGGSDSASVRITVDTAAPRLAAASAVPLTFSPNGDGRAETATVTYRPAEACSVRVGILDSDGDAVRWLHGWRAQKEQAYTVTWDGRVSSGSSLVAGADGQYRFVIERRDSADNIARQGIKVLVDRTLGFPATGPTNFSPNGDGACDTTKLGFKLTRTATVSIRVQVGDEVVRTLALGSLSAGKHTAVWDGRTGSGGELASCRPTFTVTATSTLGESSVSRGLVLDLSRPKISAGSAKTTSAGAATKLSLKVTDAFSATADVTWTVTDSRGRRVASAHPGRLTTGKTLTVTWKPKARGSYTVTFRATDLAGNREETPARTSVTVR